MPKENFRQQTNVIRRAAGVVRGESGETTLLILAMCLGAFLFFSKRPLVPDVAWLIEGTRRWLTGGRLYVDILENNPPLIFYETGLLTGGQLTAKAYVAGVSLITAATGLWALRLRGPFVSLSAVIAMLAGGLTDFGQRDHLALIFVIPFLLVRNQRAGERLAIGTWAFLGVGLKPYLLLIPGAALLARMILDRSIRRLLAPETLALGGACVGYLAFVLRFHPEYVHGIIPLARFVYWTYGNHLDPLLAALTVIAFAISVVPILSGNREWIPTAAATIGAIASFYVQGRYWSYHLVPAVGLAIILACVMGRTFRGSYVLAACLLAVQILRGPHPGQLLPRVIPPNIRSVAFLVSHVFGAYPETFDCGVRNTTRFSAIWAVPGAWNIIHDGRRTSADRQRAREILSQQRSIILGDIVRERPEIVFVDARPNKPYYAYPFDYVRFLGGLAGYRKNGHVLFYDVWTRSDLPDQEIVVPSRRVC